MISKINEKRKPRPLNFSEKVLQVVRKIPHGKFLTYKEVAKLAGSPNACRAVGNAVNKSADLHPHTKFWCGGCHRVIRSDGKNDGYRFGEKNKVTLLRKEGQRE